MLGRLDLRIEDHVLPVPPSIRAQALLGWLALHADEPQSRQRLAGLLWPESTQSQARTNLRNVLHVLRRSVPLIDNQLQVTARTLCWRSGTAPVDVREFAAACAEAMRSSENSDQRVAALRRALEHYRGDLLEDITEGWLIDERERLAETRLRTLQALTRAHLARGEHAEALRCARELVRIESLDEDNHRLLIQSHQRAGDRAGALRAYHACSAVLERELQVTPDVETQRLYAEITRTVVNAPVQSSTTARGPALIGRAREWDMLGRIWRAALTGGPSVALVTGEPGIGKTHLADELAQRCAQRGAVVARSRSYDSGGDLGYEVVGSWLRSALIASRLDGLAPTDQEVLGRIVPDLVGAPPRRPGDETERLRLFAAVVRALRLVSRPLLLVADDIHWADGPSIELIQYVTRSAGPWQLLVVLTARREELDEHHPLTHVFEALVAADRLTEIPLSRLGPPETAALAEHLLGHHLASDLAAGLYAETEGNPLFVVETVRSGWDGSGPAAPSPKLQAVISARLRRLSPLARHLLDAASCIGRSFTADLVQRVTDVDDNALVTGLDELWRRGMIREHGVDSYDFSHGRIRTVAHDLLSPAARRQLQLRVAEGLLTTFPDDPDAVSGEVARHYEEAGRPLDAIGWYRRAAGRAQHRFADAEAIRQLERARALALTLPGDLAASVELDVLAQAPIVVSTIHGYESDQLVEIQSRAVELADRLGRPLSAPLLRSLVMTRLCRDDLIGARVAADDLARLAHSNSDAGLETEAAYLSGVGAFWAGDFRSAATWLERVGRSAPATEHLVRFGHDPGIVCLSRLANTRWFLGDPEGARVLRREAQERAARLGHDYTSAVTAVFALLLAMDLGKDDDYRRLIDSYGDVTFVGFNAVVKTKALRGYVDVLDGRTGPGMDKIHEAIRTCRGHNLAPGFLATLHRVLVAALHAAGDPEGGLRAADAALRLPGTPIWIPQVRRVRANFLSALQRPAAEVEDELNRAAAAAALIGATGPLALIDEDRRRLLA